MALTQVKLNRPDSGGVLQRERLHVRLDEACRQPLVWIHAPAGSGKTTLVSSYLASRQAKSLWYQMDADDADPATFFHYLGQAAKPLGHSPLPVLSAEYHLGLPVFARRYFREVFQRLAAPGLLVLDNFQDAGAEGELHHLLARVFDHIPDGINVIVISRGKPPAAFARLVANRRVCLIGGDELRFSVEEGLAIARRHFPGRTVTAQQLERLDSHLQGWMAGLILWLSQGADADDIGWDGMEDPGPDYLFDYFFTEIYANLDSATRHFLEQTAVLPRMTATLCQGLTGNDNAGRILADLVRRQCFTARHGADRPGYEYHPMFRAFLRTQARERLGATGYRALQDRAGRLLAASGSSDAAMDLLAAGENWPAVAELVLEHAAAQIEVGRHRQLAQWIDRLPAALLAEQPWLGYWQGVACTLHDNDKARSQLEKAYARFREETDVQGMYLSWCAIADTYTLAHTSFAGAARWLDELERLQQAHPAPPAGEARGRLVFSAARLAFWARPGHPALPGWMAEVEAMSQAVPDRFLQVMAVMQLSLHSGVMGEMARMRDFSRRIVKLLPAVDDNPLLKALLTLTRYANDWMTADFQMRDDAIDSAWRTLDSEGIKTFSGQMLAHAVYHAACDRDLPRMKTLLDRYGPTVQDDSLLDSGLYQMQCCYYELLSGQHERAIQHGEMALARVRQAAAPLPVGVSHCTLACAYIEAGRPGQAREHLDQARQIAREMAAPTMTWLHHLLSAYLAWRQDDQARMLDHLEAGFRLGRERDLKSSPVWLPRMMSTLCGLALAHGIEADYARRLIHLYAYTPDDSLFVGEHWPWPVEIHALGHFELRAREQSIDTTSKTLDLLKVLIAFGGRDVHIDTLADALWQYSDGDRARASLKINLHRLRRLLGEGEALILKNHHLSLDPRQVWLDIWHLEDLLKQAHQRPADPRHCGQLADRLLHGYRGPFLAGEAAGWAVTLRETLHQRLVHQALALTRITEQAAPETAVDLYRRTLDADPLSEGAYQGLIRGYQAQGRHAEARSAYARCVEILAANGGITPSPETTALLQD